jgi:hypothetical protein
VLPVISLLISAFMTGCASFGPTIYIETEKKVDDFIVTCTWGGGKRSLFHGGGSVSGRDYSVISSKEEFSCGLGWGSSAYAEVSHPLYAITGVCQGKGCKEERTNSGAYIVRPKEKLKQLDECEQKFKEGYWSKDKWPGSRYGDCVKSVCGFPFNYLENYQKSGSQVDKMHFKKEYNDSMLECLQRVYPILKKYKSRSSRKLLKADERMEGMWVSDFWEKYK